MINERENERRVWRRQEEQEEKGPRQVPLKSRWRKERVWDIAVPELYTTGTLDRTVSVNFNFLSLRPVFQVVTLPMTPRQKILVQRLLTATTGTSTASSTSSTLPTLKYPSIYMNGCVGHGASGAHRFLSRKASKLVVKCHTSLNGFDAPSTFRVAL